jgi:hypothetical protein
MLRNWEIDKRILTAEKIKSYTDADADADTDADTAAKTSHVDTW